MFLICCKYTVFIWNTELKAVKKEAIDEVFP